MPDMQVCARTHTYIAAPHPFLTCSIPRTKPPTTSCAHIHCTATTCKQSACLRCKTPADVWRGGNSSTIFCTSDVQLATTYVHIYATFLQREGWIAGVTRTVINTEVYQYRLMSHILFFKGKSIPILGPCFASRFNHTKL